MSLTLTQARVARNRYVAEFGRTPSPDELVAYVAIKEQEDEERFVQCAFAGNTQTYTYEVRPGPRIKTGDYLIVYSPYTERDELVQVKYLGRGSWSGSTKIAHRVEWKMVD